MAGSETETTRKPTDGRQRIALLIDAANKCKSANQPEEIDHLNEAIALASELNANKELCNAILSAGFFKLRKAEYKSAYELLQRGLILATEQGDEHFMANANSFIGSYYRLQGDYAKALEHHLTAFRLYEKLNDKSGLASAHSNLGLIHNYQANYEQAIDSFKKSLALSEEIGNNVGVSTCHTNIGYTLALQQKQTEALEHHKKALSLSETIKDEYGIIISCNNAGDILRQQKKYTEAQNYLHQSVALAKKTSDKQALANALNNTGKLLTDVGKHNEANEALLEALGLAEQLNNKRIKRDVIKTLYKVRKAEDRGMDALQYLEQCIEIERELDNTEIHQRIAGLQLRYEIEQKEAEAEIERLKNVELKKAYEDLKATQTQMIQQEKMASLGQLTAGLAHEINNPINFVSGNIGPLKRDFADLMEYVAKLESLLDADSEIHELKKRMDIDFTTDEMRQLMQGIEEGANRTTVIVRGLRNFSRTDENEMKDADINDCLKSTLSVMLPAIDNRIKVETHFTEVAPVEGYPGQLNQAFMNLINNAVQAIESTGEIQISTVQNGKEVEVRIADNGCGMSDTTLSRIFEPFFTTKPVGKGAGLGLSISFGIVEKHGGDIRAKSKTGEGSVFIVSLPAKQASK